MSETPRARLGRLRLADLKAMRPPPTVTLREHLEAIRWHMESEDQDAERDLYVRVHEHAVAALAILDAGVCEHLLAIRARCHPITGADRSANVVYGHAQAALKVLRGGCGCGATECETHRRNRMGLRP